MRVGVVVAWAALSVSPAAGQLMGGFNGGLSFGSQSDGRSATVTFNPQQRIIEVRPVTGAPFSGSQFNQSVQTLPDGTRITRQGRRNTVVYRDSAGRVRIEQTILPGETRAISLPQIADAVAGYLYVIDSFNRIAHRLPLKASAGAPPRDEAFAAGQTRTTGDGTTITTESLGTKTISGVTVLGTKSTAVHPAGSRMGNDRPVTTSSEQWFAPQIGLPLYSEALNPGGQEAVEEWKDFSVAEPDAALFQVPARYQVVDETGPFTVKITLAN